MSDIRKRLELLRKKKLTRESPDCPESLSAPDGPAVVPDDSHCSFDHDSRQSTINHLKNLISSVKERTFKDKNNDAVPPKRYNGLLSPEVFEGTGQSIEDLVPGEYLETPYGECFRVKTTYPYHHYQGSVAVSELLDKDPELFGSVLASIAIKKPDYSRLLFFDTETTGLDTGAGVYIFLAGLGYFEGNRFVVEQYFMRDFPEEPAVLDALEMVMNRFDYIVTYNGKTYDWPLLESRYAMNRRPVPMNNPVHLDLLHIARRLYKNRLESCKLVAVEEGVLNFSRVDDIPGALLPERYFQYIRSRDARFVHQAFAHNANDIVSMAAILSSMITMTDNPCAEDVPSEDMFSYARVCDVAGDHVNASGIYTAALKKGLNPALYQNALQALSLIYKKTEEWHKACELWETMIQTAPDSGLFPYIELAKYHEHQAGDHTRAMKWVLELLHRFPWIEKHPMVFPEIRHRLARLERKCQMREKDPKDVSS